MTPQEPRGVTLDRAGVADRNLVLAGEFTRRALDDPALRATIPDGATLVLIPDDDPALAQFNLGLALQLVARGEDVYLRHLRQRAAPAAAGEVAEEQAAAGTGERDRDTPSFEGENAMRSEREFEVNMEEMVERLRDDPRNAPREGREW
jgi:hypothetical protein